MLFFLRRSAYLDDDFDVEGWELALASSSVVSELVEERRDAADDTRARLALQVYAPWSVSTRVLGSMIMLGLAEMVVIWEEVEGVDCPWCANVET